LEIVTILPSGDTIAVVDTHLDHSSDQDRMAQAKKINEVFSNNRYPTILAGDLNAEPGNAAIAILEERWFRSYDPQKPQPTFPSSRPARKIDYVMFRPQNKWKVLDEIVIQNGVASDHCALLVTLQLVE
jgi:endonuclease/exonuclease/phosphatase family metal-dependent hydrolase